MRARGPAGPSLASHIRIARLDHWVKNIFVLPGMFVALAVDPARLPLMNPWRIAAGLLALCLVASSNYVLNELLDAPFDRQHPLRRHRPAAAGELILPLAWMEWPLFFLLGIAAGACVSRAFVLTLGALWVMGILYNVPPVRLKDIVYVDVLSEALNNPIRFLAGWYLTGTAALPITSLLIAYWMAGCYFMNIKRYAEIRDPRASRYLVRYRKTYAWYTEKNLLVGILFFGSLAMLFFGEYMGRYRLEMVVAFPFVAAVMGVYFALAFKPDSAAERPELLIREPLLMAAIVACAVVIALMLFVDLPWLHQVFVPSRPMRP
jgi:4-hydroxybenzoate polyprenyltransferase